MEQKARLFSFPPVKDYSRTLFFFYKKKKGKSTMRLGDLSRFSTFQILFFLIAHTDISKSSLKAKNIKNYCDLWNINGKIISFKNHNISTTTKATNSSL